VSVGETHKGSLATLFSGASASLLVKVLGAFAAFGLQVYLARLLGAEEFGKYVFALTIINFCALFSVFGFDKGSIKFIPGYRVEGQAGLCKGYIRFSTGFVFALSSLVALLLFVVDKFVFPDGNELISIAALLVPVIAVAQLYSSFMQSIKRIFLAQIPQMLIRPLLVMIGVYLISQSASEVDAAKAVWMNVIAAALILAVAYSIFARYREYFYMHEKSVWNHRKLIGVVAPLLGISFANIVLTQAGIVMVGILEGKTEAGIYAVSGRIAGLVVFVLTAVETIAAPLISELYAAGKREELQGVLTWSARVVSIVAFFVCAMLVLADDIVLGLFGDAFLRADKVLVILLASQLLNALTGSVSFLMMMTGHQKQALVILAVAASLNVLLNIFFIPAFGILGAAATTLITTALWNVSMYFYARRILGFSTTVVNI
jgi:O-antigen/teichoic acid export membrane protein